MDGEFHAAQVLSSPEKRRVYDAALGTSGEGPAAQALKGGGARGSALAGFGQILIATRLDLEALAF